MAKRRRNSPLVITDGTERYPDEGLDPQDDLELDSEPKEPRRKKRKKSLGPESDEQLHTRLCEMFKEAAEFGAKQRERELIDLKFFRAQELSDQWPEAVLKARGIGVEEGTNVPERPCLMIETLKHPVNQVINEIRNARIAINLKHKGDASPEEAHLRQGLIRAIEADSNASIAYLSAAERAAICGTGNFRIITEYANDGDEDLDIVITEIPDQSSVYWGPSFKRDRSDAECVFIVDFAPPAEFKRRWPGVPLAKVREGHPLGEYLKDWVSDDVQAWAECYFVDTITEFDDDPMRPLMGRPRVRRKVRHVLFNADEILEEVEYPGRYLPVCFMPGERHVVDGEVTYKGIVSSGKEPARLGNYLYSAVAEHVGLSTKAPFILDPRQIEGYENYWQNANIYNFPYLPARRTIDDAPNVDLGYPKRNVEEPPIQHLIVFLQHTLQAIMTVTGRHGPSLGQITEERSGKAIRELKVQGELGSSHYLNNLSTITIPYAAKVVNDLLFWVYNRPGRNARLLGDIPGEEEEIIIGVPFVRGDDGRPIPVEERSGVANLVTQAGQFVSNLANRAMGRPAQPAQKPKTYRLTQKGEYVVQASAGQSFQTQREENFAIVSEMLKSNPQMLPLFGDILAKYMDGPMSVELAERFKMLNPALSQISSLENLPPEARAAVMQMQAQMQQMQQMVGQLQQQVATDAAKAASNERVKQMEMSAEMQIKQAELHMRFQIERAKIQAEAAKVRATIDNDQALAKFDAEVQQALQAAEHAHEIALQRLKMQAEAEQRRFEAARDVRKAAIEEERAVRDEERKAEAARRATEFMVQRDSARQ